MTSPCCLPLGTKRLPVSPHGALPPRGTVCRSMIEIPGGSYRMGSEESDVFGEDGEGPVRLVELPAFRIDAFAVSNEIFGKFVASTGYRTDAERYGWSFVFESFVTPQAEILTGRVDSAPWWLPVRGADWRRPRGPGSNIDQIEAEWEMAARGGLDQAKYPWGDVFTPDGCHRCNTWQGKFPVLDTGDDGYIGTAPVSSFDANGFGLYNVVGNVWEWCADKWSANWVSDAGPVADEAKIIRGGSYLCHADYCNRYRCSARSRAVADTSTGHIGFRCAL